MSDDGQGFPTEADVAVDFGWEDKRPLTGRLKAAKDKQKKTKAGSFGKFTRHGMFLSALHVRPMSCTDTDTEAWPSCITCVTCFTPKQTIYQLSDYQVAATMA